MKYFFSISYLTVGIILPLVYLSIVETNKINSREILLLILIFIFCTVAGIWFAFTNKTKSKLMVSESSKRLIKEEVNPSPIRPASERIKDRTAIKKVVSIGEPKTTSPVRTAEKIKVTNQPEASKSEVQALMEDIKNLIKLESWLMALQKANELIHYYPDTPEADKIRGNINSLVKKVQENRLR
ncbi:MAG: hypothetical protein V1709_10420 [Planctomycetota bacterium]